MALASDRAESLRISYKQQLSFIKSISSAAFSDGRLNITGPLTTEFLQPKSFYDSVYEGRSGILAALTKSGNLAGPVLFDLCDDAKTTFSAVLPKMIEDSSVFTDLLD